MRRRLVGNSDLFAIVTLVTVVGIAVALLMSHLQVRHEVLALARAKSELAYRTRQAEDHARHLALEAQIREAAVLRQAAPSAYGAASAKQRVLLQGAPLASRDAE